jgi:L-asparaginase
MIKVFTTGGTIAKIYDEISGDLHFDAGHLEKMLGQGRSKADLQIEPLMMKDSLQMSEKDREVIYQAVQESKHVAIMITHGTDTMVETAKKLSTIKGKTIVLVGAMIPYAFKNSDALFNIGCALGALQCLDTGVYVVMNGKVFAWDGVVKDRVKGEFGLK